MNMKTHYLTIESIFDIDVSKEGTLKIMFNNDHKDKAALLKEPQFDVVIVHKRPEKHFCLFRGCKVRKTRSMGVSLSYMTMEFMSLGAMRKYRINKLSI
jgi:hypothetical protein